MKKYGMRILVILLVIGAAAGFFIKRKHDLAQVPVAAVLPVVVNAVVPGSQTVTLSLPAMGIVSSDVSTTLSLRMKSHLGNS